MKVIIKDSSYIEDYLKITDNVEILNDIEFKEKTIVILGNFDGVHLGHLEIIKGAIKKAKENNLKVLLYTFREFPSKKDTLINSLSEKLFVLNNLDIDYVYLEEFDRVKDFSPKDFIEEILIKKMNVKEIFCGFNYTFGKNKSGNVTLLKSIVNNRILLNVFNPFIFSFKNNELLNVKVDDLDKYLSNGYILISSSYVKKLIMKSKIYLANKLLYSEYFFIGKVIHGRKIGRTIGFPTANIEYKTKTIPLFGVYGVKVFIEGYKKSFLGILNIGKNPTVNNEKISIETHIYDFDDDIYDRRIIVKLLKNIRFEKKMSSLEELKEQIDNDNKKWKKLSKEVFKNE